VEPAAHDMNILTPVAVACFATSVIRGRRQTRIERQAGRRQEGRSKKERQTVRRAGVATVTMVEHGATQERQHYELHAASSGSTAGAGHLEVLEQLPKGLGRRSRRDPRRMRRAKRLVLESKAQEEENWDAMVKEFFVGCHAVPEAVESMWDGLSDAPPHSRLAFLHGLSDKGWLYTVDAHEVIAVCARAAVAARESDAARFAEEIQVQLVRLLRDMPAAFGPDALDLGELDAAACRALVHAAGGRLAAWAQPLLESLVQRIEEEPGAFCEADIFAVAGGLAQAYPKGMSPSWGRLAGALMAHWVVVDLQVLLEAMLSLPTMLASSPRAFKSALARHCEDDNTVLLALGQNDLALIIDAWVEQNCNLPTALRCILHCTVEHHLMALDARRLVRASILLDDGNPYAELAIVEWWQKWLQRLVEYRQLSGWGRCSEALREVSIWRDMATAGGNQEPLAETVLQGVVVECLVEVADTAPLQVGLELTRAVDPCSEAACLLEQKLGDRVRSCLRGEDGGLPLIMAIAVANGETPVKCEPGTKLWEALTWSVTEQLKTLREVDLFCRCQPRRELKDAILKRVGGDWRALELQMR